MSTDADSKFSTGAVRSADANALRFDLIHPVALIALARTYAEGGAKYGDFNWERGMPAHDLLNHAIRHIYMWLAGDRTEPHLPHAAWGLMAAIVSDTLWPGLNDGQLRSAGCSLGADVISRMDVERDQKSRERAEGKYDSVSHWAVADLPDVSHILSQAEPRF